MIEDRWIAAHRERALSPDRPVLRGSAQNPDVFFQAREAVNPFYLALPGIVQTPMDRFAELTGRAVPPLRYVGAPEAERVIVVDGLGRRGDRGDGRGAARPGARRSACSRSACSAHSTPWPSSPPCRPACGRSPCSTAPRSPAPSASRSTRTWSPRSWRSGLRGENPARCRRVIGGRYGLASKEFTPAMAAAVFDELAAAEPKRQFTVGIIDDVTHLSLREDPAFSTEADDVLRAVFYGLGSDGTVGANKNSVKIIGENTPLFAQGYFVYDSKKSGSMTVSHLRFSPRPIRSSYLIREANFVACHQLGFLERIDVLDVARPGATFLLNSPYRAGRGLGSAAGRRPAQIIDKRLRFYVVDGQRVAREAGLGGRINTVMQTCFFALPSVLPRDEAIAAHQGGDPQDLRAARRGGPRAELRGRRRGLVGTAGGRRARPRSTGWPASAAPPVYDATRRRRRVTPDDDRGQGRPPARQRHARRRDLSHWHLAVREAQHRPGDPDLGPGDLHRVRPVRAGLPPRRRSAPRLTTPPCSDRLPDGFPSRPWTGKELPGHSMTIQVAPDDCTGCGICVDVCPAMSKSAAKHKAINMEPKVGAPRPRAGPLGFLPRAFPTSTGPGPKIETVKGSQLLAAAVRVLRGVCGLRRDALPEVDEPALRRPRR